MSYKTIEESFWTDPKIKRLCPNAKLLLMYLITNPHAHYSGLYYLPQVLIIEETGLDMDAIRMAFGCLVDECFVESDDYLSLIWVANMARYQIRQGNAVNIIKGIGRHLRTLHNSILIKHFLEKYEDLKIDFEIPSEWYPNGIQIPSVTVTVTDTVNRGIVKGETGNKSFSQNSVETKLAETLLNLILKRNPNFRKPNLQKWATHVDKMIRLDRREPDDISTVIKWCQSSESKNSRFWNSNILSTEKLREQFDQLIMKMKEDKHGNNGRFGSRQPSAAGEEETFPGKYGEPDFVVEV